MVAGGQTAELQRYLVGHKCPAVFEQVVNYADAADNQKVTKEDWFLKWVGIKAGSGATFARDGPAWQLKRKRMSGKLSAPQRNP
jgi:hypothetical protein